MYIWDPPWAKRGAEKCLKIKQDFVTHKKLRAGENLPLERKIYLFIKLFSRALFKMEYVITV